MLFCPVSPLTSSKPMKYVIKQRPTTEHIKQHLEIQFASDGLGIYIPKQPNTVVSLTTQRRWFIRSDRLSSLPGYISLVEIKVMSDIDGNTFQRYITGQALWAAFTLIIQWITMLKIHAYIYSWILGLYSSPLILKEWKMYSNLKLTRTRRQQVQASQFIDLLL